MNSPNALRTTVQLARDAERYGRALLSADLRVSVPIPLRVEGGVHVAFLLSPIAVTQRGQAPSVLPPRYVAAYDARDGMVISVRRVSPSDFGREDEREAPLGVGQSPDVWHSDGYLTARAQLYQACDRLLPPFLRGLDAVPAELRSFRASWLHAYDVCAEPLLTPYHRALGERFWRWLGPE